MTPSPIHKALSIVKKCGARFLVMGGPACVLYGAAEFSRDLHLAIGIDPASVRAMLRALHEWRARQIYVPEFDAAKLAKGQVCHFCCEAPGMVGLRIDLMSRM